MQKQAPNKDKGGKKRKKAEKPASGKKNTVDYEPIMEEQYFREDTPESDVEKEDENDDSDNENGEDYGESDSDESEAVDDDEDDEEEESEVEPPLKTPTKPKKVAKFSAQMLKSPESTSRKVLPVSGPASTPTPKKTGKDPKPKRVTKRGGCTSDDFFALVRNLYSNDGSIKVVFSQEGTNLAYTARALPEKDWDLKKKNQYLKAVSSSLWKGVISEADIEKVAAKLDELPDISKTPTKKVDAQKANAVLLEFVQTLDRTSLPPEVKKLVYSSKM